VRSLISVGGLCQFSQMPGDAERAAITSGNRVPPPARIFLKKAVYRHDAAPLAIGIAEPIILGDGFGARMDRAKSGNCWRPRTTKLEFFLNGPSRSARREAVPSRARCGQRPHPVQPPGRHRRCGHRGRGPGDRLQARRLRTRLQYPHFAKCDCLETSETPVFGDVVFRSEPVAVEGRSLRRSADDVERVRLEFVFRA